MTTPIVNLTPAATHEIYCRWGTNMNTFTDGVVEFSSDAVDDGIHHHSSPMEVFVVNGNMSGNAAGMFIYPPNAITVKKISATVGKVNGNTSEFVSELDVIVSSDGRVVFKPDFARAVNLRDLDATADYIASIILNAQIAYTNPSAATPVYDSEVLEIKIPFSGASKANPAYNPVDETPYIKYVNGTETQPAI